LGISAENPGVVVQSCRRLRDQNVAEFGASPKVYSRAARKGEPTALFEYGLMLIDGEGGPKNPARGRRLVERAAANGNINALRVLAAAYDEGLLTFKRSTSRAERVKRALAKQEAAYRQSLEKSDDPMKLGSKG